MEKKNKISNANIFILFGDIFFWSGMLVFVLKAIMEFKPYVQFDFWKLKCIVIIILPMVLIKLIDHKMSFRKYRKVHQIVRMGSYVSMFVAILFFATITNNGSTDILTSSILILLSIFLGTEIIIKSIWQGKHLFETINQIQNLLK